MKLQNIMIVEDDLNIARELKYLLLELGYKVTSMVKSGEEALLKLETEKPDLITMDIELEGKLDGIETAKFIVKNYSIPIVFTTSHVESETIEKAKTVTPYGYIVKPIRESDIRATIEIAFYKYRMELLLREKDELLQTVIDTSPNLIFVKDSFGKYILVNKMMAEVYNTDIDSIVGKTDFQLADIGIMSKEKVKSFVKADQKVMNTKQSMFIPEEQITFPNGKELWIQTRKLPLTLRGNPDFVLGIVENITELKDKDIELKNHKEHLRLINRILRHDLTNDLAVIGSSIKLYDRQGNKQHLENVTKFVNKSVQLIKRMNNLERFLTLHQGLKIYDARNIIDSVIENYQDIDIEVEGNCKILGNDTFSSIIDNIVKNAIVHGKADKIKITIFDHQDKCFIKISDFGIGIPDKVKSKIFDENFKYGETGHTGIGLYIVKKSLENIGGRVYVENNKPCGTSFILSLKLMKNK
ncbi:MAG: response regulator [Candidatus Cloacimonetes bacterium]|nr:response regulator [Candidatus Cloacimonadota bacterium]